MAIWNYFSLFLRFEMAEISFLQCFFKSNLGFVFLQLVVEMVHRFLVYLIYML